MSGWLAIVNRHPGAIEARAEACLNFFIANNTRHVANFLVFPGANCGDGFIGLLELDAGSLGQSIHNVSALLGIHRGIAT